MQQIGIVKKITDAAVMDYTKADGTQSTIKYRSLIVSLFGCLRRQTHGLAHQREGGTGGYDSLLVQCS